jgi:hypothetical protein
MIYRGLGFLAPPPPPSVSKLSLFLAGRAYRQEKGGGGGRGATSDDRGKAWPSINHSVLSGDPHPERCFGDTQKGHW